VRFEDLTAALRTIEQSLLDTDGGTLFLRNVSNDLPINTVIFYKTWIFKQAQRLKAGYVSFPRDKWLRRALFNAQKWVDISPPWMVIFHQENWKMGKSEYCDN
jgi:hypothetical protein